MRSENFSYGMRAVVGVYLFYLAYQLIGGHLSGESSGVLFLVAGIAFIAVGAACVFSAVRFFWGKMK